MAEHAPSKPRRAARPNYHKIHERPLPLIVHALPPLIPHNPLSYLYIAYAVVSQWLSPPSSLPTPRYQGVFHPATASVHVTDPRSIQALWQDGFFGKGSLSRSEPSWLDRQKRKLGLLAQETSEEVTRKRREERKAFKQERAWKEQQALELAKQQAALKPKPEDEHSTAAPSENQDNAILQAEDHHVAALPSEDQDTAAAQSTDDDLEAAQSQIPATKTEQQEDPSPEQRQSYTAAGSVNTGEASTSAAEFNDGDSKSITHAKDINSPEWPTKTDQARPSKKNLAVAPQPILENEEHLQLTLEEAFFLAAGLGVLDIFDPSSNQTLTPSALLQLFCAYTSFPPRTLISNSDNSHELLHHQSPFPSPDDRFLISYVAYHHFRSLGWVVRPGIKFAVDLLLYNRGPVFSHAEFAVMVIPAYLDPAWQGTAQQDTKPWHWLHMVNRVQSQVRKTLVLCYVEIPPPGKIRDDFTKKGLDLRALLAHYKVREVILRRWIPNRNRD